MSFLRRLLALLAAVGWVAGERRYMGPSLLPKEAAATLTAMTKSNLCGDGRTALSVRFDEIISDMAVSVLVYSSARFNSASYPGHRHHLPGEVWVGKNGRLRPYNSPDARAHSRRNIGVGDVPHSRIGLPDQERVCALQQIPAGNQDRCILWRDVHPKGCRCVEEQRHSPPHYRRHPGTAQRACEG